MRFLQTHWKQAAACAILGVLLVRMIWLTAATESGPAFQWQAWPSTVLALLGYPQQSLDMQDEAAQAQFWLAAVQSTPDVATNAELSAGAAWVLDTPQWSYRTFERYANQPQPELDRIRQQATFESLCRTACLKWIANARGLHPRNVEWARAQALLLFVPHELHPAPRTDNWREILAQCAHNDPGNALYKYLEASELWRSSAEYKAGSILGEWPLLVHDDDLWKQGIAAFEAGQQQPFLSFGTHGNQVARRFAEQTSLSRFEALEVAFRRSTDARAVTTLYGLMRWQYVRGDAALHEPDLGAVRSAYQSLERINEQVAAGDNFPSVHGTGLMLRYLALGRLNSLQQQHPGVLAEGEVDSIAAQAKAAEQQVNALQQHPASHALSDPKLAASTLALSLALVTVMEFVLVLLAVAGIAAILARLLGKPEQHDRKFGALHHLACWILAIALTVLVLGVLPTRLLEENTQQWIIRGLLTVVLLAASIILLAGIRCWIDTSVWLMCLPLLTVLIPALIALFGNEMFGVRLAMPWRSNLETEWMETFPDAVRNLGFQGHPEQWLRAANQWRAWQGVLVTVTVVAACTLLWFTFQQVRTTAGGLREIARHRLRGHWQTYVHIIVKSFLAAAAVALAAYFIVAPMLGERVEQRYQAMQAAIMPVGE